MNYLIIGASSGLGRDLAYTFAKNKNNLILVSRDKKDLTAIKSDIELKYKVNVKILICDFSSIDDINSKLLIDDKIFENLKGILFPIGNMFENDNIELNAQNVQSIIFANYLSVTHVVSKLKKYLLLNDKSSIVGFGSVSGVLGRKFNSNYAASKRALESYFESLAFESLDNMINLQFYILGYLNTNLSFGQNLKIPKGSTKKLSKMVYKNLNIKFKKIYYPFIWSIIIFVLKIVPFSILLKLNRIFK
jgi:short-subunit dehydrogenase|tara:strand:+ start:1915 stop:2658 length:744 start_codon:yes stop_codon:yes gene_type:complete